LAKAGDGLAGDGGPVSYPSHCVLLRTSGGLMGFVLVWLGEGM